MQSSKILFLLSDTSGKSALRYVLTLAHSLSTDEIKLAVAVDSNSELVPRLHGLGIKTDDIDPVGNSALFKSVHSFFYLKHLLEEEGPDIVHLNGLFAGVAGGLAARLAGTEKIIFTAHSENYPASNFKRRWRHFCLWLAGSLSHVTITTSKHARQQLAQLPFMDKKVKTIYYGAELIPHLHSRAARKKLLEKTPLKGIVDLWKSNTLWLGSLLDSEYFPTEETGAVIKAISTLQKEFSGHGASLVYFLLVKDSSWEEVKKLIKREHLETTIFLISDLEDPAQYLKAFDILLMPTITEGLSPATLESGVSGVPMISFANSELEEFLDNENGVVIPADLPKEKSLREAITFLADHPEERVCRGTNLRNLVMAKFNLEKTIRNTKKLYFDND